MKPGSLKPAKLKFIRGSFVFKRIQYQGGIHNMAKMKCPKCKSHNVQVMGNNRKGFSVGKAFGGAILTGGIGTLAGFAGKKGKYECFCGDCGHRFKVK